MSPAGDVRQQGQQLDHQPDVTENTLLLWFMWWGRTWAGGAHHDDDSFDHSAAFCVSTRKLPGPDVKMATEWVGCFFFCIISWQCHPWGVRGFRVKWEGLRIVSLLSGFWCFSLIINSKDFGSLVDGCAHFVYQCLWMVGDDVMFNNVVTVRRIMWPPFSLQEKTVCKA